MRPLTYEKLFNNLFVQQSEVKSLAEWARLLFPDGATMAQRAHLFEGDNRLRSKKVVRATLNSIVLWDLLGLKGNTPLRSFMRKRGLITAYWLFEKLFSEEDVVAFNDHLVRAQKADCLQVVMDAVMAQLVLPEAALLREVFPDKVIVIPTNAAQELVIRQATIAAIRQLEPHHKLLLSLRYGISGAEMPQSVRAIQRSVYSDRSPQYLIETFLNEGKDQLASERFIDTFTPFFAQ